MNRRKECKREYTKRLTSSEGWKIPQNTSPYKSWVALVVAIWNKI